MVSPVGFGRSIPLQQAAGAAGAGAAPVATPPPPPAASGSSAVPAATPRIATIPEALQFVDDLWVPQLKFAVEGVKNRRQDTKGTDERKDYWYYPMLGKALAGMYQRADRSVKRAAAALGKARNAGEFNQAIAKFNTKVSAADRINGDDIKRFAIGNDSVFLQKSIALCLDSMIKGVDSDYYEEQLYKILASSYRGGANRSVLLPVVTAALRSVRGGATVDAAATGLASDSRFKLNVTAPAGGSGAAPTGLAVKYTPEIADLARQIIRLKALQDGEALTEAQVEERATALLAGDKYKESQDYFSELAAQLKVDLEEVRSKPNSTKYVTLKSEGTYTFGSDKSFGFAKGILGLEFPKMLPITDTLHFGLSGEAVFSTGVEKEAPGLSADMSYVGGLRANKSAAPLVGTATVDLNYDSEHSASVKTGLIEGTWGAKATYKTPSFFADASDDFRIQLEGSVTTEKMDNPEWSKGGKFSLGYKQSDKKKDPRLFDKANVTVEVLAAPAATTSKLIVESGIRFAGGMTLAAKYTRVVLGDVNQVLALTYNTKLSDVVGLSVEGSYANQEKQSTYGLPNSGISMDGTEVAAPSALNASSIYKGLAKFIFNIPGGIKPSLGVGAAYVNSSVEDLNDNRMRWFVMGGLNY